MPPADDTASRPDASKVAVLSAAASAAAGGNHDEALRLWADARRRFPDALPAWLRASELLIRLRRFPEAEIVLAEGVSQFPGDFWLARTRANLFRRRGDEVEAYTEARALRHAFPDNPTAHADLVQLLLNQKRGAAAEAEAKAGLVRFPDNPWLLHGYASSADLAGNNAEAAARWTELLSRHPEHEPGYGPIAKALIAEGRLDEASGIAHSGRRLLPRSAAIREACEMVDKVIAGRVAALPAPASIADLLAEALRADFSGAWAEAARLWDTLRTQSPAFARAYAGAARALRRLGRIAESEIVLAEARRDLPADAGVLQTWAEGAVERGDLASALVRFRTLRKAFPGASGVELAIARTLHRLGLLDEADIAFAELARRNPDEPAVAQEFASLASERGDSVAAIRRWTSATAASPCYIAGYWRLADEMIRVGRLQDADAVLCDAAARFRDDLETGLRWAMSGRTIGDAARCNELCRRFPELAPLLA